MWIKKGLIYNCSGLNGFDVSHCHKPTPLILSETVVRIFFGVRDKNSITRTTYIDVNFEDIDKPKVIYIAKAPVLDIGKIGTFDDSGANVCSIVRKGNLIYMYHIGWNPSTTVHTRNAIGLSVSKDNGETFVRLFDGSVVDRDKDEPYYTGAVDVILDNDIFKMWYTSGLEWKLINGKHEIFYQIKYAESKDGINWQKQNIICIMPENEYEVNARPCVIKENEIYKMWYSKRNLVDFRINPKNNYRGGYAESKDGIIWNRKDNEFGLSISEAENAWG